MKRWLALGISILVLLSVLVVTTASESTVLSELSGESQYGGSLIPNSSGWRSAPEDPQTVYIEIVAPNVRLKKALREALTNVTRTHNLKPVYVSGSIDDHDMKGRVVVVYLPHAFSRDGLLSRECGVSGILYYSYAGDAKTFVDIMMSRNTSKETKGTIKKLALELKFSSVRRLNEEHIMNQTVWVAYWWNLKARVGGLREGNPYEMVAREIAAHLDRFLENS